MDFQVAVSHGFMLRPEELEIRVRNKPSGSGIDVGVLLCPFYADHDSGPEGVGSGRRFEVGIGKNLRIIVFTPKNFLLTRVHIRNSTVQQWTSVVLPQQRSSWHKFFIFNSFVLLRCLA